MVIVGDESSQSDFDLGELARPGHVLLGKYRIERVLGVGGDGGRRRARCTCSSRSGSRSSSCSPIARQPEWSSGSPRGRTAIKIKSEHVVRVLDVGTLEGGAPYMVMEYLEGRDLELPSASAARCPSSRRSTSCSRRARRIAEAHALGIVHRDLKPREPLPHAAGRRQPCVKVLDFGISKAAGPGTAT